MQRPLPPSLREVLSEAKRKEFVTLSVSLRLTAPSKREPGIALTPASLLEGGVERSETEGVRYSTYTITVMPMRTVSSGVKST